jgi:hypothetical protein
VYVGADTVSAKFCSIGELFARTLFLLLAGPSQRDSEDLMATAGILQSMCIAQGEGLPLLQEAQVLLPVLDAPGLEEGQGGEVQ